MLTLLHYASWFPVVLLLIFSWSYYPVETNTWKLDDNDTLNYNFHQNCTVITKSGKRENVTVEIFVDPCNRPNNRRFMHCNTKIGKCECYKNWEEIGKSEPNYTDPDSFEKAKEWFVYEKFDKGGECFVMKDEKCGQISEVSPYRCQQRGRCTIRKPEDNYGLYCSLSTLLRPTLFRTIIILKIVIILMYNKIIS